LLAHDAETVAGRRLHDPPALEEALAARTQLLQARDFGVEVVGLDVQVHLRLVLDALQQQEDFSGPVRSSP
jgi:hypothetical protein